MSTRATITDAEMAAHLRELLHDAQVERSEILRALAGSTDDERAKQAQRIRRLTGIDENARGLLFWLEVQP